MTVFSILNLFATVLSYISWVVLYELTRYNGKKALKPFHKTLS